MFPGVLRFYLNNFLPERLVAVFREDEAGVDAQGKVQQV